MSSEPEGPDGSSAGTFPGLLVHGNTLHVPLAPDHGFVALMEAAHGLGEVAYVDRSAGLLETIVVFDGYPVGSVLCTLEPGRRGWTDVTVIVESLTGDAAPPDDAVAALGGRTPRSRPQTPVRYFGSMAKRSSWPATTAPSSPRAWGRSCSA